MECAHQPCSPRILLVPLRDVACTNPSDRRRIEIVHSQLRKRGFETAVVSKEEAVARRAHLVLIQNRDFAFWNRHVAQLRGEGKQILFTCSDLLAASTISQAHSYESYALGGLPAEDTTIRGQLADFITQCAHVFVGSRGQAEHLRRIAGERCPPISVDGDPIDTEIYRAVDGAKEVGDCFRFVWEGYLDNIPYLTVCAEAIRRLSREMKITIVIIGSRERRTPFLGTRDNRQLAASILATDLIEFHEWSPLTVASLIRSAHAGVAPAFLGDPFSATKPANKAIIFNHLNLPVIASATDAYREYITDGRNGFIARDEKDWLSALRMLAFNPSQARKMGLQGHVMSAMFTPGTVVGRMIPVLATLLPSFRIAADSP